MPYARMGDLAFTSYMERLKETFRQIEYAPPAPTEPVAGYMHTITSDSTYSMYNQANADRNIEVLSNIEDPETTFRYDFNMPLAQYIIPRSILDAEYNKQHSEMMELIQTDVRYKMPTGALKTEIDRYKLGWVTGAQSYMGWALAWGPGNYKDSPITGKVTITLGGDTIGTLNYYWGIIPEKELIIDPMSTISITPESLLRRFDLESMKDLFKGVYAAQKGKIVDAPDMYNKWINPTFDYLPAVREEIKKYYNIAEDYGDGVFDMLKTRYGLTEEEAFDAFERRVKLKVDLPQDTAEWIWNWYFMHYPDRTAPTVKHFSPKNSTDILRIMNRTPVYGWLVFDAQELQLLLKRIPAEKITMFKSTLKGIMREIERKEITAFNYSLFNYVGEGFSPATFAIKALDEYNHRIERGRERREQWALVTALITISISAIPVVGPYMAMQVALFDGYSRLQTYKAQLRKEEEKTEKIEEIYEAAGVEDRPVHKPTPKPRLGIIGTVGIAAAAVAGYLTLT